MLGNIETIRNIHDSPEKEGAQLEYKGLLNPEFSPKVLFDCYSRPDWGSELSVCNKMR